MGGLSKFSKMQDYHCACCGQTEYNGKYDIEKNTMVCTRCRSLIIEVRTCPDIFEVVAAYEQSDPRPNPE